ncbi:MAG: hypothetical protein K2L93_09180 [Muribaculaceae bacterium]|nr:hypothetical protein [Muribaculaceae bacterium]
MKTTKNERKGLMALSLALAVVVVLAIVGMHGCEGETVPVRVIESSTSTVVTDTVEVRGEKKKVSTRKGKKKERTTKSDMLRDPFEHPVNPR